MSLIFINNPMETFTPSHSGAIATIIWESACAARRQSLDPVVITRTSRHERFAWVNTIALDYPYVPRTWGAVKLLRLQRKITGWHHLRHQAYAVRVAKTIRDSKLAHLPFLLYNDPEMAVFLRSRFPNAFILHWFQNQMECSARVRREYGASVDMTLAVSDFTGRWVQHYYDVAQAHTVYNGVDSKTFHPVQTSDLDDPIINFLGRTGIEKAPDLLLRAAVLLSRKTSKFGVQIVGSNHWDRHEPDAYQSQLQSLADELRGAGICIRQTGHIGRSELPRQLQRAHIHVVPSRWDEPFGLTTVEGMASGLATVASNTGGTPEVVGDAGLLFERDSVDGLADHLENMVMNPGLRREYARKARERAEEFTWERTWNTLRTLAGIGS